MSVKEHKTHQEEWDRKFELYKEFVAENKAQPKVKDKIFDAENNKYFHVGSWADRQRRRKKEGVIPKEQISALEVMEFVFDQNEANWQENLKLYKNFKKEFQREPKKLEWYCDKQLGAWCSTQRNQYKKGLMSDEKKKALKDEGFPLEGLSEESNNLFQTWFCSYERFINNNGREPRLYEVYEGRKIGIWIDTQKKYFKMGILPTEEHEKIGKYVAEETISFEFMMELYCSFAGEKGKEPSYFDTYKGYELGRWYASKCMQGIIKGKKELDFEEMLEIFTEFKHIYSFTPRQSDTYLGIKLGAWCAKQRKLFNDRELSEDTYNRLCEVGFDFSVNVTWEKYLEYYKNFVAELNREPRPEEKYNSIGIGTWVVRQRQEYKLGILKEERLKKLEEACFSFNPRQDDWLEKFKLYKEFKTQEGREPRYDEVYKDDKLGQWYQGQKVFYLKGRMKKYNPDHVNEFASLGADFIKEEDCKK